MFKVNLKNPIAIRSICRGILDHNEFSSSYLISNWTRFDVRYVSGIEMKRNIIAADEPKGIASCTIAGNSIDELCSKSENNFKCLSKCNDETTSTWTCKVLKKSSERGSDGCRLCVVNTEAMGNELEAASVMEQQCESVAESPIVESDLKEFSKPKIVPYSTSDVNGDSSSCEKVPLFKAAFKYFKSKNPPPDLNLVIDIGDTRNSKKFPLINLSKRSNESNGCFINEESSHLQSRQDHFKEADACMMNSQSLMTKCSSNCSNLALELDSADVSNDILERLGLNPPDAWQAAELEQHPGLVIIRNVLTRSGEYRWAARALLDYCQLPNITNIDQFIPESVRSDYKIIDNPRSLEKLRWATLGYHHNWETKRYSEGYRSHMPIDILELCGFLGRKFGFPTFTAEAAIVHYYHHNSTLSGHVDNSELNLDAPLFAVSLGQSAVFLIGGKTLDEISPTPLWLKSGDVMMMTGESRLCYHGIPRIVKEEKTFTKLIGEDSRIVDFMNENRINLNIRQVNYI